jgi:hypothetical protein
VEQKLCGTTILGGKEMLGKTLCSQIAKEPDMNKIVKEFQEVLDLAC